MAIDYGCACLIDQALGGCLERAELTHLNAVRQFSLSCVFAGRPPKIGLKRGLSRFEPYAK